MPIIGLIDNKIQILKDDDLRKQYQALNENRIDKSGFKEIVTHDIKSNEE